MPLVLKPREALPAFTFSPASPSPPISPSKDDPGSASASGSAPRPPADFIPERDMNLFGAYPLAGSSELGRGLVSCQRCGKVVTELALGDHKRLCSHILDGTPLTIKKGVKGEKGLKSVDKKRRASDFSTSSDSPTRKRVKLPDGVSPDDDEALSLHGLKKGQIKKLQKEQAKLERKAAKAQEKEKEKQATAERKRLRDGPVDLDRQCGVINHKGLPCSRSIICKNHGVGLKRAVEGRTRSYDDLVLEWQRVHNPNFKEPAGKKERDAKKAEKKERDKQLAEEAKRRKGLNWEDDDGFDMDAEEGKREVAELVHVARMAGERVCPKVQGSVWISVIGGGFSGVAPTKAGASKAPGPGGVGTGTGVWRAGNYEFAQVGDMLTKALAARPKPQAMVNIAAQKAQAKPLGTMDRPPQAQQYPVATM